MLRRFVGLMIVWLSVLAVASSGVKAQDKKDAKQKNPKLMELIAMFPVDKTWAADKKAEDAAAEELLKDPEGSIAGIIEVLSTKPSDPKAKSNDFKARLALHTIVIRIGGEKDASMRRKAAQILAATLNGDRPKDVQGFVIRELQLIGDEKEAAAIGKLLLDEELSDTAARALLAIKVGAAEQFHAALGKATAGKQRALIVHGLGTLKDKSSANSLLKLLADEDRDTRLSAAWALANLPDAAAADKMLKLADAAKGYERDNATVSCFLLAENLLAAGDKKGATQIYTRLQESRTDEKEAHVKEAATKGLAAAK